MRLQKLATGVATRRSAVCLQTIAVARVEGGLCATGLTSVAVAAATAETSAGTAARALVPLVARGAVQAATLPSAVAAMLGGHIGQRVGHSAGGENGAAIGDFSGNVGGGALAGGVVAGPAGAAVGASVGLLGWGISRGIRLAFDSERLRLQQIVASAHSDTSAVSAPLTIPFAPTKTASLDTHFARAAASNVHSSSPKAGPIDAGLPIH